MESLNLIQGLQIAIYGFLTVFIMLSFLMLIINIMSKIVASLSKKQEQSVVQEEVKVVSDTPKDDLPKQYVGELQLIDVDEKTAACIMAIISEETNIPLENLIFKRIRLIKEEN